MILYLVVPDFSSPDLQLATVNKAKTASLSTPAASRFYTPHAGDCQLGRGISRALQVSKAWEVVSESTPSPLRQQTIFTIVQFLAVGGTFQRVPIPDRFLKMFSASYEDPLTPAMGTSLGAAACAGWMDAQASPSEPEVMGLVFTACLPHGCP